MSDRTCTVEGCDKQRRNKTSPFCETHYARVRRHGSPDVAKIDHRSPIDRLPDYVATDDNGCLIWIGAMDGRAGYGIVSDGAGKQYQAHRFVYESLVGPVPAGLELDHLCRVRACVLPLHLEPVTHAINVKRGESGIANKSKTHCKWGHEFTPENTIVKENGHRACRICTRRLMREGQARYRAKHGGNPDPGPANADKTHCKRGHEFTPENTSMKGNARQCRTCGREATARYLARKNPDRIPRAEQQSGPPKPAPGPANTDKTHCKHGHEFTSENTIIRTSGGRACRECGREAQRRYQQRLRDAMN